MLSINFEFTAPKWTTKKQSAESSSSWLLHASNSNSTKSCAVEPLGSGRSFALSRRANEMKQTTSRTTLAAPLSNSISVPVSVSVAQRCRRRRRQQRSRAQRRRVGLSFYAAHLRLSRRETRADAWRLQESRRTISLLAQSLLLSKKNASIQASNAKPQSRRLRRRFWLERHATSNYNYDYDYDYNLHKGVFGRGAYSSSSQCRYASACLRGASLVAGWGGTNAPTSSSSALGVNLRPPQPCIHMLQQTRSCRLKFSCRRLCFVQSKIPLTLFCRMRRRLDLE